ncbi:alpha/beta hydrolase [Cyclobacteriaceae bacterium]|nr:alpha/beta hydrolase [Cyclobacteriaceae bacterium]
MQKIVVLSLVIGLSSCYSLKQHVVASMLGYKKSESKHLMQTPEPGVELNYGAAVFLDVVTELQKDTVNPELLDRLKKLKGKGDKYDKRAGGEVIDTSLVDCKAIIVYPKGQSRSQALKKSLPVIYFLHGGGFSQGDLKIYKNQIKLLAKVSGCIVVAVEYPKAPLSPYPSAVNTVYQGLLWIEQHIGEFGGDNQQIFIGGDSAGGNLATVTCLQTRDLNGPKIKGQILYYPVTTFKTVAYASMEYYTGHLGKSFLLDESKLLTIRDNYVPDSTQWDQPYASPLLADLADLPPALIITAQCDPLRDQGEVYAAKLHYEGVEVVYYEAPGMVHGFVFLKPVFKEAAHSMKLTKKFVKDHL